MAAAADSRDTRNKLVSFIECSVCRETFSDPRQLPCTHTFCLRCINGFCKKPGEIVSCPFPSCGEHFKVPVSGVGSLPKNVFVEQMKDLVDRPPSIDCEVCSAGGSEMTRKIVATMFCVDCDERQCETCADNHSRMKISQDHKLIKMDEKDSEAVARTMKTYCSLHHDKPLELYCFDCKTAICLMCSVLTHKPHQCADVNEVADEFRKEMTRDIDNMRGTLSKCGDMIKKEKKKQADFRRKVKSIEREICDRVEQLKKKIDEEKASLMKELRVFKDERIKQINNVVEEIEQRSKCVESLVACTEQLRDKGRASDITQQKNTLHDRASELVTLGVLEVAVEDLGYISVTFTASPWPVGHVVGQLQRKSEFTEPTLKHVIPSDGRTVAGLTFINNQLFVLRKPCKEEIQVYNAATFTQQRTVRVAGLDDSSAWFGLTSCKTNNCLYVCDFKTVFRVDLSTDGVLKCFSNPGCAYRLSVNAASHVMVTSSIKGQILDFTTSGSLVHTIESDVTHPFHAVQLNDGEMVVCHHGSPGSVSVINNRGKPTATYRNSESARLISQPSYVAVTKSGSILVADRKTNRLVLLNSSLSSARDWSSSLTNTVTLKEPECLYLDESHGRLYVGERSGQRVLIFDHVNSTLH